MLPQRYFAPIFLLAVVLLVGFIYSLGMHGPFLLDDFHNLSPIGVYGGVQSADDVLRYVFGPQGDEIDRFIAKATFLINDQFWPSESASFKATNIAIHLITGLVLYLFLAELLDNSEASKWMPALIAVFWLVLPAHVTTVLYVVQRMTQLTTLFLLSSLYFYVLAFKAHGLKALLNLSFAGLCALLSIFSKGNGAALLLLYPLVGWFVGQEGRKGGKFFEYFPIFCMALFSVGFVVVSYSQAPYFEARVFTLPERLLSQAQILFQYVHLQFFGVSDLTLFHDDQAWRLGEKSLWVGAGLWCVHGAIIICALRFFERAKAICFGVLWFYIGHIIESTILPLELMFEHRNYMPSIGLLVVAIDLLLRLAKRSEAVGLPVLKSAIFVLPLGVYLIALVYQSSIWADYRLLSSKWAAEHPDSLRAQYAFSVVLEQNNLQLMSYDKVVEMDKKFNDPAVRVRRLVLACRLGESHHVVEAEKLMHGDFSSGLLHQLEDLSDVNIKDCVNEHVVGGLIPLYEAVGRMPKLLAHDRYAASFFDKAGDYYVSERRYDLSLMAREKAFEFQPTIATALKLVELAILGGDFELAQKMLTEARVLNERRWFKDAYAMNNIDRLADILSKVNN